MRSTDKIINEFIDELFATFGKRANRAIRWAEPVLRGIRKIRTRWWLSRSHVVFEAHGRRYKLKFHPSNGGLAIIMIGRAAGSPDMSTRKVIGSFKEALEFCLKPDLSIRRSQHLEDLFRPDAQYVH
jgi:hypothetical protein